jgi:nucleoside-diphosphate-sugar epimerase
MKILITGNMGYVGPVVTKHLHQKFPEATLWGADLGFFAHCLTNAYSLPEHSLDAQWFVDTRHMDERFLKDVDAVVHLAAISNDPMGNKYLDQTMQVNFDATVRIAQAAKRLGVGTFVFASSCSVYGFSDHGICDENSSLNPLTPYATSKMLSERALTELAGPEFKVTNLRFATACGMSPRLRLDLVLNDFVASAVTSKTISILSDGTPWRPLIHVEDMARAIEWAIRRPPGESDALTINAGSDDWNYQVKDLAQAVVEEVAGTEVTVNPNAPVDKRSYRVSFEKYRRLAPEFQPKINLSAAVKDLKIGIESMPEIPADFRSSQLMRLNVLSRLKQQGQLTDNLEWKTSRENPKLI